MPAIGSGTYRFGHWKKAQEFKVERFDEHFQPADNAGLLVIFYGTSEAAYTALIKQEADVLDSILPHQILEIEATDYLHFVSVPSNGSDTLVVNVRNAPYDDPALRLALSLATPRERMLNEFYEGYGNIAGSVIAPANAVLARREHRALRPRCREGETGPRGRGLHLGLGGKAPASGVKPQRRGRKRTSGGGGDNTPPPPARSCESD